MCGLVAIFRFRVKKLKIAPAPETYLSKLGEK